MASSEPSRVPVSREEPLLIDLALQGGGADGALWAGMRIHRIASTRMADFDYSTKLNAEWDFLCLLRDEGRRCADAFLQEHGDALGQRSSLDLDELLNEV